MKTLFYYKSKKIPEDRYLSDFAGELKLHNVVEEKIVILQNE
jgi:hypothetical protein